MPTSYSSLFCSTHSDCNKVQIQYLLCMGYPDFSEGGEAPLCLEGHAQIKPRYSLFNILCQLPPRPVRNHCPNDFARQRQQSQTSRDCCRKPAGSKQRGTGRGVSLQHCRGAVSVWKACWEGWRETVQPGNTEFTWERTQGSLQISFTLNPFT